MVEEKRRRGEEEHLLLRQERRCSLESLDHPSRTIKSEYTKYWDTKLYGFLKGPS
jgi:hypothetical protein